MGIDCAQSLRASPVHSRKCATHPFRYRLSSFMQALSECPQLGGVISRIVSSAAASPFAEGRMAICRQSAFGHRKRKPRKCTS